MLTLKLPHFDTLFATVRVAAKDLLKWMGISLVLLTGFLFASHILFGPYSPEFSDLLSTFMHLLYMSFGFGTYKDIQFGFDTGFAGVFFFAIFFMIFYFILAKMLVSMVIIRYMYLRKIHQTKNEAISRILKEKGLETKEKWKDLC